MADIYDQHAAAFSNVSAFVILRDGERVATIAFKFPKDGAGRLYAYVHWFGLPMVRGFASGGGYDKKTAACAAAVRLIPEAPFVTMADAKERGNREAFRAALAKDGGQYWDATLRDAGFTVFQAV